MNPLALAFFVVVAGLLWVVPRKWALAPFLAGCCLITLGQGIEIGPATLPIFRMLILIGFCRAMVRGESMVGGINGVDKILFGWAAWYLFASFFHDWEIGFGPVYTCGQIFNLLGFYLLARAWVSNLEDTFGVIRITALLLVPIAAEMLFEKATGRNLFSFFGGVSETVLLREGRLRAQGPFMHPILAGTVGATCLPWFVGIMREHRAIALTGMTAGSVMVFASASSGPIMSLMFAGFALVAWKFRHLTGAMRRAALLTYILLMFLMARPPYYLISKIDLSGGSTGWHRSFLIDTTIAHFGEWWLFGTDHTRHWMPDQGTAMSPTHTDITNYYIGFGVAGGFLAMLLILAAVAKSFAWVGVIYRSMLPDRPNDAFMIWCFGAALFSHLGTGISVAYFDQSVVFYWLNVAVISSVYSVVSAQNAETQEESPQQMV
jgi:hypothetical protein